MVTRFFLIGIFLLSSFSFLFGQEYELVFDLTQNGSTLAYDTPYGQLGINDHLIIQTQSHGIIRSDGTSDGTRPICTELNPAHIHSMGVGQTKVYIFTQDFYEGRQLWVYDVISDSLTFVKD